jgi:hypothetical protein
MKNQLVGTPWYRVRVRSWCTNISVSKICQLHGVKAHGVGVPLSFRYFKKDKSKKKCLHYGATLNQIEIIKRK